MLDGYNQWVVRYMTISDDAVGADGFYKVAGQSWGENGPEVTSLSPAAISLDANELLYMWSNQLGGNVQYLNGDDELTFFAQQFMNGSESEFESGPLTLVCYERCPIGTLEASDLQNFEGANSPYSTDATTLGEGMTFTFATSGASALTLVRDSNSEPVRYASGLTENDLSNSPYSWGINSGVMVTSAVAGTLTNPWDVYDAETVTVFYTWETGLNDWNQLQVVLDDENEIVSFSPPLEFSYQHSDANDRTDDAGAYDGQTYFVNYGGNGDFWGIPFANVGGDRWYPLFNIDDGVAMGPDGDYVIKAREIEQKMQSVASSECSTLVLNDPAAAVPTATVDSADDIGDMPAITDDPAVIDGVIQL